MYYKVSNKNLISYLFIFFTLTGSVIAQNNVYNLQKSVYFTYADFYNNTPKLIDQFKIDSTRRTHENWKNTYAFKLFNSSTGEEIKKFWGFSDGKSVFINHNNETFRLSMKNEKYLFIGRGIPEAKKKYIKESISSIAIINIDDRKKRKTPTTYLLDSNTGTPIHEKTGTPINYTQGQIFTNYNDKRRLIFFREKKGERTDSIVFSYSSSNIFYKLKYGVNSYDEFIANTSPHLIKLCVGPNDNCITVDLTEKETNRYFKISDKTSEPTITELPQPEDSYSSSRFEKNQEKRLRKLKKIQLLR